MRRHRAEHDVITSGQEDRPIDTHRVGCRSGGRGDHESIGLVRREVLLIQIGMDGDHGRGFALKQNDLVQGIVRGRRLGVGRFLGIDLRARQAVGTARL